MNIEMNRQIFKNICMHMHFQLLNILLICKRNASRWHKNSYFEADREAWFAAFQPHDCTM